MSGAGEGVGMAVALVGLALMLASWARGPRHPDLGQFLTPVEPSGYAQRMSQSLLPRMATVAVTALARRLEMLLPARHVANLERQLAMAGLAGDHRAGMVLVAQLGLVAGLAGIASAGWGLLSSTLKVGLVLLPLIGFMLPSAFLKRRARARDDAIFKDLPDMIDMLAVAVEAGSGFDAALSVVCDHFRSPMADELRVALHGMELGMPRREALQELKRRTGLEVVRTLVLALVQADALGIPVGRVLTTQSAEIRSRRRAWAREKAARLPVKIMFPLVLFIFPPIIAIVVGPAISSFGRLN